MNNHYIGGPHKKTTRQEWLNEVHRYRQEMRQNLNRSLYDREDLQWVRKVFNCHFTFMYDQLFYNQEKGYTIDTFLEDGLKEFGGYDSVLLWHAYPRLGIDQRNQFDFYRDMPGGLTGLRIVVDQFHNHGVKVFINYNPWDTGTRRETVSDEDALVEMVRVLDVDGIFLDTLGATSRTLRGKLDHIRPGVALVPEIYPDVEQLSLLSASWAQWLNDEYFPGMLKLKWIEPRHMSYQIRRWDKNHRAELESAFFNGSGFMIWENVFGTYNPWPRNNRLISRKMLPILHQYAHLLDSDDWDPYYPCLPPNLFAHRWPGDGMTLFTVINSGPPIQNEALLEMPHRKGYCYYDLWNGTAAQTQNVNGKIQINGSIDRLGCFLAIDEKKCAAISMPTNLQSSGLFYKDKSLASLMEQSTKELQAEDERSQAKSVTEPDAVERTSHAASNQPPSGMVYIPGQLVHLKIQHPKRECGCYPDPGTKPSEWHKYFSWGLGKAASGDYLLHDYNVRVKGYFIDKTEVTNAQYKQFMDETGYRPRHSVNFLKHWPEGRIPPNIMIHPVVYVDIDDARAYAKWAGKRLPTEAEWHLAAQGTDGRKWPWGNEAPNPVRCNMTGRTTMPATSLPDGRSPFGCYHMSGNVWEWTESCRNDGHTRFSIIRGGSFFKAEGSSWYVVGGPQPCNHHAKFIHMWPGLDRCGTVGFRCVKDAL
ncbi:MAG: SUMF1/EgtB/PvdO family nonheme iron enzyme [Sedimentisphaerales bacterium]|nr:SUMF1/EgtB/PvdO family nonheme iron enzyme [Sedimentisphaerales bacterium]